MEKENLELGDTQSIEEGVVDPNVPPTNRRMWKYIVVLLIALVVLIPAGFYLQRYFEESDPNYVRKHQGLGNAYMKERLYGLAIEEYQKVVKVKPESVDAHYGMAIAYLRSGKAEETVKHFESVLKVAPDRKDIRYSLGIAYYRMGRLERAMEEFHKVAQQDPQSFQVFNGVGSIQMKLGNKEKAIAAFKHAIELRPDYYPAYINLAEAYEKQEKFDMAEKQYEYVRKNASKKPDTEAFARIAEQHLTAMKQLKEGHK